MTAVIAVKLFLVIWKKRIEDSEVLNMLSFFSFFLHSLIVFQTTQHSRHGVFASPSLPPLKSVSEVYLSQCSFFSVGPSVYQEAEEIGRGQENKEIEKGRYIYIFLSFYLFISLLSTELLVTVRRKYISGNKLDLCVNPFTYFMHKSVYR